MNKNVLYIKTVDHTWLDIADTLHEQYNWEPVLWVGTIAMPASKSQVRLGDAIFYDHMDARRAIPPKQIPDLSLPAIDADLLEKMSKHESVVFEMMSRFILGKDHFSYNERRHFYYNLLRIWIAILRKLRVDIVIIGSVPHRIYDYVICLICQELGITYLMIEQTNLPHLSYGISSITDRSRAIRKEYDKIHSEVSLDPRTEAYLNRIKGSYEDAMPSYFKNKVIKAQNESVARKIYNSLPFNVQTAASIAKNAMKGRLFEETGLMYFKRPTRHNSDTPDYANQLQTILLQHKVNIAVRQAECWYKSNSVKPDLMKPYIYFAAHFQPERSTCPDAGVYHDLYLMVDVLSKSIPNEWYIYYKEHPSIFRVPLRIDNPRDTRFYERIRRIPNCVFIDYKTDPFELIDNSMATASARGTAAWEGVLRGVPAITFGDWWFTSCPGITRVYTVEECRIAIKKIQSGYKPDQSEIRRYLAATERCCEDIHWRRRKDACIQDIEKNDPVEYKRRIRLLAKVLADEYFRVHGLKNQGQNNQRVADKS